MLAQTKGYLSLYPALQPRSRAGAWGRTEQTSSAPPHILQSLGWSLLTQAQSSLNLWNTSQRETLTRKKISQNYLLLLLLQKLTHFVWGICTAPHPHESVSTCTSPPQPSFLPPSARQSQLQTLIFHVTYKPSLQHPNSDLQPIYSHPLSYLCNNCVFMTGELPYYVQGCSGKGLLFKTFLKPEYRLSQTSTCLFRPAENSRIFLGHDF